MLRGNEIGNPLEEECPRNATNCTISTRPMRKFWFVARPRDTNSSWARNTEAIEITVWMASLKAMYATR